jgi:hypothetical protein
MAENSDNSDIVAENSQELATIEEQSEKRGRGRPKGSRDAAPRRPRTVRIVEEEPREPTPTRASAAPLEPSPNDFAAPPSPRTLFKQASETMAAMQTAKEAARRAYWQDAINRTLR